MQTTTDTVILWVECFLHGRCFFLIFPTFGIYNLSTPLLQWFPKSWGKWVWCRCSICFWVPFSYSFSTFWAIMSSYTKKHLLHKLLWWGLRDEGNFDYRDLKLEKILMVHLFHKIVVIDHPCDLWVPQPWILGQIYKNRSLSVMGALNMTRKPFAASITFVPVL